MKEEVLTTLAGEFEEARIKEVNDTPQITVIDVAVPPVKKSSPNRVLIVILAIFLAALAAVIIAVGTERLTQARDDDDERLREFATQWSITKQELQAVLLRRRSPEQ
jgi:uncharacterized protein involved in exopolysaccharide biosynthesis